MIRKILAAMALFATLLLGVQVPAGAAMGDCPNARLCMWVNPNYTGVRWEFSVGTVYAQPNHCLNLTASASNNLSSIYNRAGIIGLYVAIYSGPNCTGTSFGPITAGGWDANFASGSPILGLDNTVESIGAMP